MMSYLLGSYHCYLPQSNVGDVTIAAALQSANNEIERVVKITYVERKK